MDVTARGWLFKTATRNYWRVRGLCDKAELVQDGFLIYHAIGLRYQPRHARHHMALFQRAFTNYITDLANKRTRGDHICLAGDLDIDLALIPDIDETAPDIDEAPECIRRLITATAARPHRLRMPRRCNPDGTRETESEWLSRVAGFEVPADAHLQLLAFMRG